MRRPDERGSDDATVRVGVVGAGAMGADHVRTLSGVVPGARVSEVFDADRGRAEAVAGPAEALVAASGAALIGSSGVDAVLVCSPDSTHADLVRACIAAGKPVLCEKPLALTPEESASVVDSEVAAGRRLVQVGFMRRYDPGFAAIRETASSGAIGEPRLVHFVHRNVSSHTSTTSANLVTGSMIHELDTVRWLLDDEIASIEVRSPLADGFRDPQLATVRMRSGVLVSIEVFVNATYGYDVRCELVGTTGTVSLAQPQPVTLRRDGADVVPVPGDFVTRFADAYRLELTDWVAAASDGRVRGPGAWDGHLANVAAEAGVRALSSGERVQVDEQERPALYA
ncbi:MAG: Gfo/Idh/MocA family oxidoreductase [Nocardioidaceae bacterium]